MGYFRMVGIFVVAVLGAISNMSFDQTPFNYDTLKISFGYVIPDYRKTPGKDTTDSDFLILCPAIYKNEIDRNNVDIYGHLTTVPQPGEFYVGQLPNRFIDSCFIDKPGDTLVLLGSFDTIGTAKAVISEIDYMEQGDILRTNCQLKLVDSISPVAKMGAFVAVRPDESMGIYAMTYKPIDFHPLSQAIIDSIRIHHIKTWLDNRGQTLGKSGIEEMLKHALDSGYCEITFYDEWPNPYSSRRNYPAVLVNLGPKIPDIWSSVYKLVHSDKGWNIQTLLSVSSYGKTTELICRFDLNGDDKAEYLVTEQEEELKAIIYSDSDSGWAPVLSGDATWQE